MSLTQSQIQFIARNPMPPKQKGRKRSLNSGDVQIDPSVFLEGGVPGKYKPSSMLKESHGKHLYCVSVCSLRPFDREKVFATVGDRSASVYRFDQDGGITALQSYTDENEKEGYLTCVWCETRNTKHGRLLLAVAGDTGVIRLIDVAMEASQKNKSDVFRNLRGHGGVVNDLRAHPCAPHLLLSASKDESCRLWNVDNGVCVAIFAGAFGHTGEVLTVDIKPTSLFLDESENNDTSTSDSGDFVFVSGAMDNHVKVWSTKGYSHLLKLSDTWPDVDDARYAKVGDGRAGKKKSIADLDASVVNFNAQKPFPTGFIQTPLFSSHKVHTNFVDCVRWFGDLLLSRSVEQVVRLWAPEIHNDGEVGQSFRKVKEFPAKHCSVYYVRFAVDVGAGALVCGNTKGQVYVWNVNSAAGYVRGGGGGAGHGHGVITPPALFATLSEKSCKTCVRHTAICDDGKTVLAACDGGTVYRWDWVPDVAKKKVLHKSKKGEPIATGPDPIATGTPDAAEDYPEDAVDVDEVDEPSVLDLLSESDEGEEVTAGKGKEIGRSPGGRGGAGAGRSPQQNQRSPQTESAQKRKKTKRAPGPYMNFCKVTQPRVVEENPTFTFGDVGKRLGEIWRGLSEDEKAEYRTTNASGEMVSPSASPGTGDGNPSPQTQSAPRFSPRPPLAKSAQRSHPDFPPDRKVNHSASPDEDLVSSDEDAIIID